MQIIGICMLVLGSLVSIVAFVMVCRMDRKSSAANNTEAIADDSNNTPTVFPIKPSIIYFTTS